MGKNGQYKDLISEMLQIGAKEVGFKLNKSIYLLATVLSASHKQQTS